MTGITLWLCGAFEWLRDNGNWNPSAVQTVPLLRRVAMADDTERRIAERAYEIWNEEGRLLGRDKEHWAQARRDLGLSDDVDLPPLQPAPAKLKSEAFGRISHADHCRGALLAFRRCRLDFPVCADLSAGMIVMRDWYPPRALVLSWLSLLALLGLTVFAAYQPLGVFNTGLALAIAAAKALLVAAFFMELWGHPD
jgi:hypothetical protein